MLKTVFFLASALLLSLNANANSSKPEDLLSSHKWKLKTYTVDPPLILGGTPVKNLMTVLPSCLKDNLASYNRDGTILMENGKEKCVSTDPQSQEGRWILNAGTFETSIGRENISYQLKELDTKKLVLVTVKKRSDGVGPQEFTFTAVYQ